MINTFLVMLLVLFIYLPIFIVAGVIIGIIYLMIYLIRTKLISNTFKIIIMIIAFLLVGITLVNFTYEENSDDLYQKMKKVTYKSLRGESREQVVELLGKPNACNKEESYYKYDAGYVFRRISWRRHTLWSHTSYYVIEINFDETGKAKSVVKEEQLPRGG